MTPAARRPGFAAPRLVLAALLAAACGAGATSPRAAGDARPAAVADDTVPIRTARAAYRLEPDGPGWRMEVAATYTNRTGRTVYAGAGGRHPAFVLERLRDGAWVTAFRPVALLVAGPPLEVAPGASRTDTLVVIASPPGLGAPAFAADSVPGTYRLVYDLYATVTVESMAARLSDPLPVQARSSNAFQVER